MRICWDIEKRNEIAKPLLVLDFWTVIKKLDSPVQNPAIHSEDKLLYKMLFFASFFIGTVLGKASFKSEDKPKFKDALIFTIFCACPED